MSTKTKPEKHVTGATGAVSSVILVELTLTPVIKQGQFRQQRKTF